jgi:hypothetical protein
VRCTVLDHGVDVNPEVSLEVAERLSDVQPLDQPSAVEIDAARGQVAPISQVPTLRVGLARRDGCIVDDEDPLFRNNPEARRLFSGTGRRNT